MNSEASWRGVFGLQREVLCVWGLQPYRPRAKSAIFHLFLPFSSLQGCGTIRRWMTCASYQGGVLSGGWRPGTGWSPPTWLLPLRSRANYLHSQVHLFFLSSVDGSGVRVSPCRGWRVAVPSPTAGGVMTRISSASGVDICTALLI